MRRRKSWLPLVAVLTLGASGCDWWHYRTPPLEAVWYAIPWFDHMVRAKYVHPYQTDSVVRYTPPGTVPVGHTEPDWSGEWVKGNPATANRLVNPLAGGITPAKQTHRLETDIARIPRNLDAAGDTLYQTFCSVCHGNTGDGRGLVGVQVGAPSLLSGRARAYTDGYIYSIIRYGRSSMPRYGDKVYQPNDRWAIVNHIRKLQAGTPAVPEPPAALMPMPPGPSMTGSTGAYPQ